MADDDRGSILIVDDEETIRRQLRRFFERERYEVYTASTGKAR